jgi:cytochrome P450
MTATSDTFWITRNPVGRGRDWLQSRRRIDAPRPPGPRGRPFVGVMGDYWADPCGYLRELRNRYGDVYRLPWPMAEVVMVNHPDHVAHVLNSREGKYGRMIDRSAGFAGFAMGAGLGMLDGEKYRQRRKALAPMFGRRQLTRIASCLADEFDKSLARWDRFAESGERIDLHEELPAVIMPAFMRVMFSKELTDAELHQVEGDMRAWMSPFTYSLGFLGRPRLLLEAGNIAQAWLRMRRWVLRRVDERLADGQSYDDTAQVVLDAHRRDGGSIRRRDAVLDIMSLMGAAWDSVDASLAWTLGLLPQNPAAQQRLYDEVDGLGGAVPTFDDLDRLQWAKACFAEGLRLEAPPFLLRVAKVNDTIGGYRIRRGSRVAVSPYALHRDARWWGPDPDSYDPMRFYDKDTIAARPNLAYVAFGAGPRRCLGMPMTEMMAQLLLAQLHQRFRVQIPTDWSPRYDPAASRSHVPAVITKVPAAAN